jgi:RHS repeat-associated protein
VSSISGSLPRTYAYDNAGNTLSYAGATFTYNNRGRMKTASNAGTTATYTYNALGQRVRRATSSVTTLYAYDEAGRLVGEYTSAGVLIQETVWLGDVPIATLRPNGSGGVVLYYVHADQLNTPRLATDTANNIRWRWDSDPFGATPPNENPSALGLFEYILRFPGQQYDAVVGLHYNYFRDYDPAVGRYIQNDPIASSNYAQALDVQVALSIQMNEFRNSVLANEHGVEGANRTHPQVDSQGPIASSYPYARSGPLSVIDRFGLLDETKGGGGPGGGGGLECRLVGQFTMFVYWKFRPMPVKWVMCIYDCNTSCPGSADNIIWVAQRLFNPPYRCWPTYNRRLGN